MRSKNLPTAAADAIRRVFTNRQEYSLADVADLTGVDSETLLREVEARDLDIVPSPEARLPWREVAYLALRTWTLETIFEALGYDASSYVPDLLRPTTLTVTLPTYQVRALEVLARDQQMDASTFLHLHLLDLVSAESPFLAEEIPGFLTAFHFPFGDER
jgi:hypothetical protein